MAVADAPDEFEAVSHTLVADLHVPQPWIYWTDLAISAAVGWTAFALAVLAPSFSAAMWVASLLAVCGLYRGVCFTHELTHLRGRALPGFETAWNILFGLAFLFSSRRDSIDSADADCCPCPFSAPRDDRPRVASAAPLAGGARLLLRDEPRARARC